MDQNTVAERRRSIAGMFVLAGVTAASFVLGSNVSLAQDHTHCTVLCNNAGCKENHPGFDCKVTDDNVCNCVGS